LNLTDLTAAQIAASRRFRATLRDGRTIEGLSGPNGTTSLLQGDAMHLVDLQIFEHDAE